MQQESALLDQRGRNAARPSCPPKLVFWGVPTAIACNIDGAGREIARDTKHKPAHAALDARANTIDIGLNKYMQIDRWRWCSAAAVVRRQ